MYFDSEAYKKAFPRKPEVKQAPPQEKACELYDEGETETAPEVEEPALVEDTEESVDSPEIEEVLPEEAGDGRDS